MGLRYDLLNLGLDELTQRSGNIKDYDKTFRFDYKTNLEFCKYNYGIISFLMEIYESHGNINWIDLGGGNAIAQREAKVILELLGFDLSILNFCNIDLLDEDIETIKTLGHQNVDSYEGKNFSDEKYRPIVIQQDMTAADFPFMPHVVTTTVALDYTKDPLLVLWNCYSQMNTSSLFLGTNLDSSYYGAIGETHLTHALNENELFRSAFQILLLSPDEIHLRKSNSISEYRFGFLAPRVYAKSKGYRHIYNCG